ncbi:MAG: hypothetical protein O7E54_02980, partial [Planctomycetota bacterium]|nr:hypothetical protein [Planctomycetota bacterium]
MLTETVRPLRESLARLRARIRALLFVHGSARLVVFLVAMLSLLFFADYLLRLPPAVRRITFFGLLAGLGVVVLRRLVRPLSVPLTDERLAARIEAEHPELNDRLASSLSFSRASQNPDNEDSPELMRRVVEETVRLVPQISFRGTAKSGRAMCWAGVAAILLALSVATAVAEQDLVGTFMRRNLLWQDVSWPRRTTLVVQEMQPGVPRLVTRGRETTVRVRAEGSVPDRVEFSYWEQGAEGSLVERIDLAPQADDPSVFTLNLPVYTSYEFTVTGGDDDRALVYGIEALTPPAILDVEVACTYPGYLQRKPETLRGGDQRLPAGSRLRILMHTNMEVEGAKVSVGTEAALVLDRVGEKTFAWEVTLERDLRYSVRLVGANGQENDPGVDTFILRALKDRAPMVRVNTPSSRADRSPEGVLMVSFTARDDHRITGASLILRINEEEEFAVDVTRAGVGTPPHAGIRLLPGSTEDPELFIGLAVIDLSKLRAEKGDRPLKRNDYVRFRVAATDSAGQRKETRRRRVEIVSEDQLDRNLQGRQQILREAVERALTRQREAASALASVRTILQSKEESAADGLRSWGRRAQGAQGRVLHDLRKIAGQIVRVMNLYVFIRLEVRSA